MTYTLAQVKAHLEDENNWQDRDAILSNARLHHIDAVDVSGAAWDYMLESLLYWLQYHDGSIHEVADIPLHDIRAVNAPDLEQQQALLVWAWDKSFTLENIGIGDNLDDVIDQAAEALEYAAVMGLVSKWPEIEGAL